MTEKRNTLKPTRIQLSRARGFNLQSASQSLNGLPCVKVDRTTKWGNPFILGEHGTRAECVQLFELMLLSGLICASKDNGAEQAAYLEMARRDREQLRGKNLACWCPLTDSHGLKVPCHADILLDLANQGDDK